MHNKIIPLSTLRSMNSGKIVRIDGGGTLHKRLEVLGIREGIRIQKKYFMPGLGPSIVVAGNTEIAIGHGMAERIWVEVE